MHARLPWVLLAVSVAANVFLVGGAACTLFGEDGPTVGGGPASSGAAG